MWGKGEAGTRVIYLILGRNTRLLQAFTWREAGKGEEHLGLPLGFSIKFALFPFPWFDNHSVKCNVFKRSDFLTCLERF